MLELSAVTRKSMAQASVAPRILVISGSPTAPSKTAVLAEMVASGLRSGGALVDHLRLKDLPPSELVAMNTACEPIAEAIAALEQADGVVIATPTFKASFSGLTKLFLDLLPQFGLAGKVVLPLATGGSLAHVLALDYALRPVVQSMGARWVVPSFYVTSDAFVPVGDDHALNEKFDKGLRDVLDAFRDALRTPATLAA